MSDLEKLFNSNFAFNKKLGQNFIFDGNLLKAIVSDAKINKNTTVLEIGTGGGTLTKEIANVAKKVVTVELDKSLNQYLTESFKDYANIKLLFKDIMKVDLQYLEDVLGDKYVIVANLPYYITTPVIFKFIEGAKNLQAMYIMVQLEVANRICASAGTSEYGAITAVINSTAHTKILRKVNRKMFVPVPNVDSAVVEITLDNKKYDIKNKQIFSAVVKSAFAMRRKTLENNLKATFAFSKMQIEKLFSDCNLAKGVRGEKLTPQQFVELANAVAKITS